MRSDQFNFMLKETFGFDTTLISGRMNAMSSNGLQKLSTSVGFILMNQSNYGVKIKDLFDKFIFSKILNTLIKLLMQRS